MDAIRQMRLFSKVAELGSFRRAAEHQNTPVTTASNAVAALEKHLGVRLLQRTTRKVSLTAEGQAYLDRCQRVLEEVDDMDALFAATGAKPKGVVRVDFPERMARLQVIPLLPKFFEAFPDIQVRLSATDRVVDVIGESIDCVVRVGALADSSLIARPLGMMKQVNVGSRDYLDRHGRPKKLEDLDRHYAVNYFSSRTGRDLPWEFVVDGQVKATRVKSRLTVSSSDSYTSACLSGLGLIQAPAFGLEPYLRSGELEEVLKAYRPPAMPVHIVYASGRRMSPRSRAFIEWIVAHLKIT